MSRIPMVKYKLKHPDLCFVGDEVGSNISMKVDGHVAGRHGKLYSFPVSHIFNYKNKFGSYQLGEKINFNYLLHLKINFKFLLRYRKSFKFPVSLLFD